MKILHTEASPGWGGQEMRILREAEGMRQRGHEVIFAIQEGGGLVHPAKGSGFVVYELPFRKAKAFQIFFGLLKIVHRHQIEIINTHSSLDAWIGGVVGKMARCLVIRTRHLSTPVKGGLNSRILYNWLADQVVTTCEETCQTLRRQAKLTASRCLSVPTGVDPEQITLAQGAADAFRAGLGVSPQDCLVGTLCVLRGWKGVADFLHAAKLLEEVPHLKWVVVGSGVSETYFKEIWRSLGLENKVVFTGHLAPPYAALAAMDIFLLLSWANEGVSQATLQAAWLGKPLITTPVGGLPEVCLEHKTGFLVPKNNPEAVANAVLQLVQSKKLREEMGCRAKELVASKFTLAATLDKMESLYLRRTYPTKKLSDGGSYF